MNVPLQDSMGLRIYRELMHRENRCAAGWHHNYGPEALQKAPDPQSMINLGKFSKFASVPMPLDVQLRELRRERQDQSQKITAYERSAFPKESDAPVSQMSVELWGDDAWHSQPKQDKGAPATYEPYNPTKARWDRKKWDVDRIQYVREGLGPAHVNAREVLEGKTGK